MVVRLLASVLLLLLIAAPAAADATFPDRPGERDFIADAAVLIDADDAREIVEVSDALLTDRKIPIIVVTIDSMAAYRARGWPIEAYARDLFDRYGIGFQDWNYGMLLLVSAGDRKARIELGGAWAGRKNSQSKRLMDNVIVPMFKRRQYSEGILLGVLIATRVPVLGTFFTSHREMEAEVTRCADAAYATLGVSGTRQNTGVLIYISVLERLVRVVGDEAIDAKISQADWDGMRDQIIEGFKSKNVASGLLAAIAEADALLAKQVPGKHPNPDEIDSSIRFMD